MIYLELMWSFFQIGLFSIGGGYAAMPLIQHEIVECHGWLSMAQFGDVVTIAEMTPGPIAINAATFVGIQVAGIGGAIVATIGCVLPSSCIVMMLAYLYYRFRGLTIMQGILAGLRPAVIAMIASSGISLMIQAVYGQNRGSFHIENIDFIAARIFVVILIVLRRWKINPIYGIAAAGIAGVCLYSVFG